MSYKLIHLSLNWKIIQKQVLHTLSAAAHSLPLYDGWCFHSYWGEHYDTCFGYLLVIVPTILVTLALLGGGGGSWLKKGIKGWNGKSLKREREGLDARWLPIVLWQKNIVLGDNSRERSFLLASFYLCIIYSAFSLGLWRYSVFIPALFNCFLLKYVFHL